MLADVFCIRVCAYAVMSNHLHLVLRMDPAAAAALTSEELARRHARLFPLVHAQMQGWDRAKV
ncbi:MAG: transposase, partial [Microthrixaceae bacterium]|nr:transposase [Microthrixaceae bacterium]